MLTLTYILSSIACFLGLIFGMILIFIAPEEQKPGKKYFILLENIFLILMTLFLLIYFYYYKLFSVVYVLLWLFFIMLLIFSLMDLLNSISPFFNKRLNINKESKLIGLKRRIKNHYSIYSILALIFYLSYQNKNLFFIESTLIFLYGLPIGSLLAEHKDKKQNIITVLKHMHFLIIALLLGYLPSIFA